MRAFRCALQLRDEIMKYKVGAPARVGLVAPNDVMVPGGNTGLDPSQTSFFQVCRSPCSCSSCLKQPDRLSFNRPVGCLSSKVPCFCLQVLLLLLSAFGRSRTPHNQCLNVCRCLCDLTMHAPGKGTGVRSSLRSTCFCAGTQHSHQD